MSSKFQGVASSYDHNDYFEDYSPVLFPVCALYLCLLAMLIFVRLPLFICHVIRTQASAHTRCLFTRTHRHAFSFIETGFLGLWAQSIKAMFCGCLCVQQQEQQAVAAAVFGFNLSLGIFRRRCKVSDEIEILSIAACTKAAPPQPAWYTILYLLFSKTNHRFDCLIFIRMCVCVCTSPHGL